MTTPTRYREFRFPVKIGWDGGRRTTARIAGKRPWREDGRFGFVRIEQTVALDTDAGREDEARALVADAEAGCRVTVSLDLPVQTTVEVRTRQAA